MATDASETNAQNELCRATGAYIAAGVASGAITVDDLTIDGPTYNASASGELTYYSLSVGQYEVTLIHSTGKGHRAYGLTIDDRGIQIGRWFDNEETSGPAMALTAIRAMVGREIAARQTTALRVLGPPDREI